MAVDSPNARVQHYSLKHKIVAWVSQNLFDDVTYTVRHGILKGLRRRGGLGWVPEWIVGRDATKEHTYFQELDLRGKIVYDVGAFVGLFALHCSRTAKRIICYEPLEQTRARLTQNLRLNSIINVDVRPFGVGRTPGTLTLSFNPLMPGGASLSDTLAAGIASTGSSQSSEVQVTTIDLDAINACLPAPDFIKIDIEGYELDALIGASATLRAHRPVLYLEMHGETHQEKCDKVRAIVKFLSEIGYSTIRHLETDTLLDSGNSDVAAHGHLVCDWKR